MDPIQNNADVLEEDGLLFACTLDGNGGAELINWEKVKTWTDEDKPLWVHLERTSPAVRDWLENESGLSKPTIEALLAEETRPRTFRGKRGVVCILRGVNTNPGSDPEDMVAIRIWSDGKRIITVRQRRLLSPRDILNQLLGEEGGPVNISELFERLIARVIDRMAGTIASFEERLDTLEDNLDLSHAAKQRREISNIRQDTVMLRRYMVPQREALTSLQVEPPSWLDDHSRMNLRDTADRLLRYIEELETAREKLMVIKDDISNQIAESSNKTLYILAIISGIFLPLAFLTGLLGINIGGMPGVENPYAFWIFCVIMAVMLFIELLIFRKLKWL